MTRVHLGDIENDGATGDVFVRDTTALGGGAWAPPSGGVSDGDKGDITVSGSGTVWTVDAQASLRDAHVMARIAWGW